MGKPDFCPYDGKQINFKNLAYEIVHPAGWSWQRVKAETVISSKRRIYIMEKPDGRVILLANNRRDGKNGLQFLADFLKFGKDFEETVQEDSYERRLQEIYPIIMENPYLQKDRPKSRDFGIDHPKHLHMVWQDNIPVFLDESDDPVMYALPCCPYCHRRLPVGWERADDFISLSLRGPAGSGKTTYIYTLANDHAAVFGETCFLNGKRLSISPAYYPDYGKETETAIFERHVAAMCRENGVCPPPGEAPPLFLHALLEDKSEKKRMIVGIYDTPAEMPLEGYSGSREKTVTGILADRLAEKLYADVFLFDPRELPGLKVGKSSISGGARFVKCRMLSPDEQAKQQRENRGQVIKASDLLSARGQTTIAAKKEVSKTMDLYRRLLRSRGGEERDHMRHMHFVGLLTKCDLLEGDTADVRTVLRKKHCLEEEEFRLPEADYGLGISWYSISALGCDAFENDHLLGMYAPIRASEPILSCVKDRMMENGWL